VLAILFPITNPPLFPPYPPQSPIVFYVPAINCGANYPAPLNNSRVPIKDIVTAFFGTFLITIILKIQIKYKRPNIQVEICMCVSVTHTHTHTYARARDIHIK